MKQTKENVQRITEFSALFMKLDEKGQEEIFAILRALEFAQPIMHSQDAILVQIEKRG